MGTGLALARAHPKVKRLRRLVGRRSARDADGVFVLEGAKVVSEALAAGAAVEGLYVAEGTRHEVIDRAVAAGVRVHELAPDVLATVTDTITPQPILAVAPSLGVPLATLEHADLVVVCVDVRDPGNAGTLLRSAEAAGVRGIVFCDGSVDVFNPKTVRATAGALFHVPVVTGGDPVEVLEQMGSWGRQRLGAAARGGHDYTAADLTRPTVLVFGNEAHGLPTSVAAALDGLLSIPMAGRSESLNVGTAAAVLCFEAARQRRSGR